MTSTDIHARLKKLELITQETVANQAILIRTLNEMTGALRETAKVVACLVGEGASGQPAADPPAK